MTSDDRSAALTLLAGDEELLVSREVEAVVAAARAIDPELDVTDVTGAEATVATVHSLAEQSMFGGRRLVVVRKAQDVAEDVRDALVDYIADPYPDVMLVVAHAGVKNKKVADVLKANGARVVSCAKIEKADGLRAFVEGEFRAAGSTSTAGACQALLEAVGTDLRELAAACQQLVADTVGTVDERAVARFYRGRAETKGFAVADAALAGNVGEALALLAAALDTGTAEVLVTSAFASGLRDIAKASTSASAAQLGMPPWKLDKAKRQARSWGDESLSAAVLVVAAADAAVKGAGVDPRYALERMVIDVVRARRGQVTLGAESAPGWRP